TYASSVQAAGVECGRPSRPHATVVRLGLRHQPRPVTPSQRLPLTIPRSRSLRMGSTAVGVLYVAAMAAVVVAVDVLLFRGHVWERLAANVGIVVVFVAVYFKFLHHPSA